MRRLIFILNMILCLSLQTLAQENLDSLRHVVAKTPSDSIKAKTLNLIALAHIYNNPDSAYYYALKANQLSTQKNILESQLASIDHIARIWWIRGELDSSLNYINKKLKIYKEIGDDFGISASQNNLGMISENKGSFPKALKHYLESIKILEKYADVTNKDSAYQVESRLASTYNNVGNIYARQENNEDGRKYYNKALEINLKLNSKRKIAVNYTNLGVCDYKDNKYEEAIEKYKKALKIHTEYDDNYGKAEVHLNFGHSFLSMNKIVDAESHYLRALELQEKLHDDYGKCASLQGLSVVYEKEGSNDLALKYAFEAQSLAKSHGFDENSAKIYGYMANIYYNMGNYKQAFLEMRNFKSANDSIFNSKKNKQVEELKTLYETDKKEKEIKLLNKEKELKNIEITAKNKTIKQQQIKNMLYAAVALLFLISAIITFRSMLIKKKANVIIAQQKKIVEETNEELNQQNEEILAQRDEIESQKKIVDEKNRELVNSINAAERIQRAFFTFEAKEKEFLPEHFVLFKPYGIVSGDFYWFHKHQNYLYMAIVDCTGHGVSGALMSMLGASFLTDIINAHTLIKPSQLLDVLSERVIKEFKQTEDETSNKEGMDIALIKMNLDTLNVEFSGANNPLIIFENNNQEAIIIKGDRKPIGISANKEKFTNHELQLKKGDSFYMFTDGYIDQFGGPQGKKIGNNRFKEKLQQIQGLPLEIQKESLENFYSNWKGSEDQVDDVCVLGVKV